MRKNAPVQSYGALKSAPFPGWPVTKVSKSTNTKKPDTIRKSIKNVIKKAEKPMPKNETAQSYEAHKLVSFPAWLVTEISKSANMKNFDVNGKTFRDQKRKETHA